MITSFALNQNLFSDNGICGKPFIKLVGGNSSVESKYRYENGRFQRDYIPGDTTNPCAGLQSISLED